MLAVGQGPVWSLRLLLGPNHLVLSITWQFAASKSVRASLF